jgi:23S rRNA-/tRNA-specific pseudouridylate synthase
MPDIIFEDNHLIAAVKRSGQTVQPEPKKPLSLEDEVKSYIKQSSNKPGDVFLGVIHRIDMPVSGLVLFAKTSKALTRMNEIFQKREVENISPYLTNGPDTVVKSADKSISPSLPKMIMGNMARDDGNLILFIMLLLINMFL